jgi:hypothetical protein
MMIKTWSNGVVAVVAMIVGSARVATGAAAATELTDEQLLATGRRCVVKLEVNREPRKKADGDRPARKEYNFGSALIVELDKPGPARSMTLATAYHVMARAIDFRVLDASGKELARSGASTTYFADRSREVAFIRVALNPGAGPDLQRFPIEEPAGDRGRPERPDGVALGFSLEQPSSIDSMRVDLMGEVPAGRMNYVRRTLFVPADEDIDPNRMPLGLLGGQATLEGMSGGLVADRSGGFLGLAYGRRTDMYNVIIPAGQVRKAWARTSAQGAWKPFRDQPFLLDSLYRGDGDEAIEENRLDWGTLEGLSVLIGNDPLKEITNFQEILVVPPIRGQRAPNLEMYVSTTTLPDDRHRLRVWLDGVKQEVNATTGRLIVPLGQRPGESMLTVIKEYGDVNGPEAGGLITPSRVDLSFSFPGEKAFSHVVRSLPAIIQSYPLYVTILNERGWKSPAEEAKLPANARLALRLDYAEAILNRAPFVISIREDRDLDAHDRPVDERAEKVHDTRFDAEFRLDSTAAWRLRRASPQRLGLEFTGDAIIHGDVLRYRDRAIRRRSAPREKGPPRMTLGGVFQFPELMPGASEADGRGGLGVFVSPRATGTRGIGSFRVDLGEGLTFDIGGILGHLFASYVNYQLIVDTQPHLINEAKILKFLKGLGFASPKGWKSELRRMLLAKSPGDEQVWLILTFRLSTVEEPGGAAPPLPANADQLLVTPPERAEGRVIHFQGWGLPGELATHFHNLKPVNPMAARAIASAHVDSIELTTTLDADPRSWFDGLERWEQPDLMTHGADGVARRILRALAYSAQKGRTAFVADVGPSFIPSVLADVLGRPGLPIRADGHARLKVVASRSPNSAEVAVRLEGGDLELSTPADVSADLGSGITIRGAHLKVSSLEARGDLGSDRVDGKLTANLSIARLGTALGVIENPRAGVELVLSNNPARRELVTGRVLEFGVEMRLGRGTLPIKLDGELPFKIGRDFKIDLDQERLGGMARP